MLIVIEGNVGVGKSTLINNLLKYYGEMSYVTKWNSTKLISPLMRDLREENKLKNPLLYEYIQLADFSIRYNEFMKLKNKIILCDRYYYTLVVRSLNRGIDIKHLNIICKNYINPDMIFYLKLKPELCISRISKRAKPTNDMWTLGMDSNLDKQNFNQDLFIEQLNNSDYYYNFLFKNHNNVYYIDASKGIDDIQNEVISIINSYEVNAEDFICEKAN